MDMTGETNACADTEDDGKRSHGTKSLRNWLNDWYFLASLSSFYRLICYAQVSLLTDSLLL